jgi:hypothetical protein
MKRILLIAMLLLCPVVTKAQQATTPEKLFTKATTITTITAAVTTVLDVELSVRVIVAGKACEGYVLIRASDGCSLSRLKAYGLNFGALIGSLAWQKWIPFPKDPKQREQLLNGFRIIYTVGHTVGFVLTFRF